MTNLDARIGVHVQTIDLIHDWVEGAVELLNAEVGFVQQNLRHALDGDAETDDIVS